MAEPVWKWAEIAAGAAVCYRVARFSLATYRAVRAVRGLLIERKSSMDIVQLKNLVTVGAALGNIGGEAMADGKINVADLALLGKLVPMFPALLAIDFKGVVPEVKDLSQAEAEELVAHFKAEFKIPQADLETKIEGVLSLCVRLSGIVAELIALFKKPEVV